MSTQTNATVRNEQKQRIGIRTMVQVGMLSAIAQLQGVVGCEATAIAGCVLLAAAVATARKALIAHLEAA